MRINRRTKDSFVIARNRRVLERVGEGEREAIEAEQADIAAAELSRRAAITAQERKAGEILRLYEWGPEVRTTGIGWKRTKHTDWKTLNEKDAEGHAVQARLTTETELHDLGDGTMFRTGGRFFGHYHSGHAWIDVRLVDIEDDTVVSEPDEAVVVFVVEGNVPKPDTPATLSRLSSGGDELLPVEPDTEEWAEIDQILDQLRQTE